MDLRSMSPEEKEAFHREAEARIKPLRYTSPSGTGRPKDIVPLARTTFLRTNVQIVHEGGENNLHYHTHSDTCWFVIRGRVRFYGVGDALIGEFGPGEGVQIPGGARYWFEKAGEEDLHILQVMGLDMRQKAERINVEPHKAWMEDNARLTQYE